MSALATTLSVAKVTFRKADGFMASPFDSWRCGEASLHARRVYGAKRVVRCWIAAKQRTPLAERKSTM
jgi:hypothetical protein